MKNQQDNSSALPTLLRAAGGVDTLETNSLCGTAADITASSNSTTEALIPQEKLREAATPNTTLTAQNRPPAQPIVGYEYSKRSLKQLHFRTVHGGAVLLPRSMIALVRANIGPEIKPIEVAA